SLHDVLPLSHRDQPYERTLAAHKQRLEILLRSLFHRKIPLRVAEPPARPTILTRLFTRRPKRLFQATALPAHDGQSVFLPSDISLLLAHPSEKRILIALPEALDPTRFYRALAIQQGQRCIRHLPGCGAGPASPLVATLFQLSEAA